MDGKKNTTNSMVAYKTILFFERVAFICNVFFLLCVLVRFTNILPAEFIPSFIIILGWVLSFFLNVISMIIKIVLLFKYGKLHLPVWINAVNMLCFIIQIFLYFILPG